MSTYTLIQRIGAGGMGTVFEARRTLPNGETGRVACKSLRDDLCGPRHRKLFFREATLNLDISNNHRGLVSVLDCIEDEHGKSHLIMELVEGCNLFELQAAHERVPWDVVRLIANELLDALTHIHEHQIVHRDLSSCNVLVSRSGDVKLSDLGLAKLVTAVASEPGHFHGKWPYAAPEVVCGAQADPRSDLFSFAATMFELITGGTIYGDVDGLQGVAKVLDDWEGPTLPDDVPFDLRALLIGLSKPNPNERRPQIAREAMAMLAAFDAAGARVRLADMASTVYARRQQACGRQRGWKTPDIGQPIAARQRIHVASVTGREPNESDRPTLTVSSPGRRRRRESRRSLLGVLAMALVGWLGFNLIYEDAVVDVSEKTVLQPLESLSSISPGEMLDSVFHAFERVHEVARQRIKDVSTNESSVDTASKEFRTIPRSRQTPTVPRQTWRQQHPRPVQGQPSASLPQCYMNTLCYGRGFRQPAQSVSSSSNTP